MTKPCEDFEKRFGKDALNAALAAAGRHSMASPPPDDDQRLLFALLEMVDWECPKYGDTDLTMETIQSFLLRHRHAALALPEPPSFLGMFAGAYSFLIPAEEQSQ